MSQSENHHHHQHHHHLTSVDSSSNRSIVHRRDQQQQQQQSQQQQQPLYPCPSNDNHDNEDYDGDDGDDDGDDDDDDDYDDYEDVTTITNPSTLIDSTQENVAAVSANYKDHVGQPKIDDDDDGDGDDNIDQEVCSLLASIHTGSGSTKNDNDEGEQLNLLQRHAGITTNLGGWLYYEGDLLTAMQLFQESLSALTCVEAVAVRKVPLASLGQGALPSHRRQDEMAHLLRMLSSPENTPQSRKAFCAITRQLYTVQGDHDDNDDDDDNNHATTTTTTDKKKTSSHAFATHFINHNNSTHPVDGFPGLFHGRASQLRGAVERAHLAGLTFNEPFKIDLVVPAVAVAVQQQQQHFIIPLEQCSKATMFNMGLIHYHWGHVETALQFFDLSSSMSQQLSPLAFDPVILAAFNNMAQIHLQHRRTTDAMELLQDALTRGNAALAAIYSRNNNDDPQDHYDNDGNDAAGESKPPNDRSDTTARYDDDARHSRRLRQKLARTVMNMGHVHFINCNYEAAMLTCQDALRLLHPNTKDAETASVWHNMGILHYHLNRKAQAVDYLQKFIDRGQQIMQGSSNHLQLAEAYALQGIAIFELGQLYHCMRPLNEALRIRLLKLEYNHWSVAESLCSIGRVWLEREEYDFALQALERAMMIYRRSSMTTTNTMQSSFMMMTTAAGGGGEQQQQQQEISFEAAQALLDIGRAYHAQNALSQAIGAYQEALQLTGRFFGETSTLCARLENLVGNLYWDLGRVSQAMCHFRREYQIHCEHYHLQHQRHNNDDNHDGKAAMDHTVPIVYVAVKDPCSGRILLRTLGLSQILTTAPMA